ncbi:MAG: hypothetical protein ABI667_01655 [Sphingomicrobium sp.]
MALDIEFSTFPMQAEGGEHRERNVMFLRRPATLYPVAANQAAAY